MGRTREFDEKRVLSGAMDAFRRKGYAAVSIKDLEEVTGLKGGSIYNSYGDKAGIFAAAFSWYNQAVLCERVADHAPESAGLGGLRALFLTLLHEPDGQSFGCLITNSAIEFGGEGGLPAGVSAGLQILSDTFTARLASAHSADVLRPNIDPDAAASKLFVLYQGILVLVRAGYDKHVLKLLIDTEFNNLEGIHDVT